MIWQALRAKLADRGPLGFASDAAELAAASAVIGGWAGVLVVSALAALVATPVVVAFDLLTRPCAGERPHRCDADCAAHRTACGGPT